MKFALCRLSENEEPTIITRSDDHMKLGKMLVGLRKVPGQDSFLLGILPLDPNGIPLLPPGTRHGKK